MNWPLVWSAFAFIFLAALPGRTTFVLLLMGASGRLKPIFIGAALAFFAQSLISVSMGHFLAFLPAWVIQIGAGILFLYFSFHFWKESKKVISVSNSAQISIRSAFLIVFSAEWGDVSQLAIASFSARNQQSVALVFGVAVFALWLITGLALAVGKHARKVFSQNHIQKFAAVGFALTGIYLILRGSFQT
jgi:putative Ca2+/H+ antiporter (TMEM165/GDT1 family)